jgi:hypothetical protein
MYRLPAAGFISHQLPTAGTQCRHHDGIALFLYPWPVPLPVVQTQVPPGFLLPWYRANGVFLEHACAQAEIRTIPTGLLMESLTR